MANKPNASYFSIPESSSEVRANTSHLTKMERLELMRYMGLKNVKYESHGECKEQRFVKRNLLHDQFRPPLSVMREEMDFNEKPRCTQEKNNQKKSENKENSSSVSEQSGVRPRPSIPLPVVRNMSYADLKAISRAKKFAARLRRRGSSALYMKMIIHLHKKFKLNRNNKLNKEDVTKEEVDDLGEAVQSCKL